jgi:hypothetical protein
MSHMIGRWTMMSTGTRCCPGDGNCRCIQPQVDPSPLQDWRPEAVTVAGATTTLANFLIHSPNQKKRARFDHFDLTLGEKLRLIIPT